MRQGGGSPYIDVLRGKGKRASQLSLTSRDASLAGFRIEKYKTPVSRRFETAGRALHNRSGWLSRQWHRLGRFPAEAFGLSRTMRARLVPEKIATPKSVHAVRQSIDKSMCADARRIPRGGRGFLTFRTEWMRNVQLYASHFPRLSLCYSVENPAFLNFCLQNCISTRSSIVICFNLLIYFFLFQQ